MNAFDQIIGYEVIRKELERITDALRNTAFYESLGAYAPRGLLLHGEPGVGKTWTGKPLLSGNATKITKSFMMKKPFGIQLTRCALRFASFLTAGCQVKMLMLPPAASR